MFLCCKQQIGPQCRPFQEDPVITHEHVLPPGFEAHACANDPWDAAVTAAGQGCDPATVYWSGTAGRCRAAIVLAPDRAVEADVLHELGLLTLFDALAVLAPPQMPLAICRPNVIAVDGAQAATIRAVQGPLSWAVLGFDVALHAEHAAPRETPEETCLAEEGFGEIAAEELLSHLCRHLLGWVDAWRDGGAALLSREIAKREARREAA